MITMTKGKANGNLILSFLIVLLSISFLALEPYYINAQANLVEESDRFLIYSGNYFNIALPKDEGPGATFDINNFGEINMDFNYVSEYESTSVFMNSLSNLNGRGYSLDSIDWTKIGSAETTKTYVNYTRTHLNCNASISASFNVFNQPRNISGFEITPFSEVFIEFRVYTFF